MAKLANSERVKKSGIRAINQGTRYDITGELRNLSRRIERGEYGEVRHIMLGVCARDGKNIAVTTLGFGAQSVAEATYTVEMMKKRLVTE